MKKSNLNTQSRIILFICGILMILAIFTPLWRIDMEAPQYPEGLILSIYPHKIAGDIDIINGLNHYIGMKTIHYEDFIEFKILPYLIGGFAGLFLIVAYMAKKRLLFITTSLYFLFCILSMIDFWLWEYNYGHNLSPDAAIIVPGMAYQPPLIGFKQLLNFGAYSMPDVGGWIFAIVGILLLVVGIRIYAQTKKSNSFLAILFLFMMSQLMACTKGPIPIQIGKDTCHFCKMTISDVKFGAEIVTIKGKVFKFDEYHCLNKFLQEGTIPTTHIQDVYISDYLPPHSFISFNNAFFLESEQIHGPMNGNIAAFKSENALINLKQSVGGVQKNWNQLLKQ